MEIPGQIDDLLTWIVWGLTIVGMCVFILPKQYVQFQQANGAKPTKRLLFFLGIAITIGMVAPIFAHCGWWSLQFTSEANTWFNRLPVFLILYTLYYKNK
jgi:hypothetical protein